MTYGPERFVLMFNQIARVMDDKRDELCVLDGVIGDADHGIAMQQGFEAVRQALAGVDPAKVSLTEVFNLAAKSFLNAVGASSGPLYATALMRAGAALKGKDRATPQDVAALVPAMARGIAERGKAAAGDKTMLDAWQPAADLVQSRPDGACLAAAADAARTGAEATKAMEARMGRAARLGARSIGHIDPGAASASLVIRVMADSFPEA